MRIIESGRPQVILDVEDAFTAQDARDFLHFVEQCGYADTLKLLVLTGKSQSKLTDADAEAFGAGMAQLLAGGSGRIAVVYDPDIEQPELEYVIIDTTISLSHRLIAQFRSVDEAKAWLNWRDAPEAG